MSYSATSARTKPTYARAEATSRRANNGGILGVGMPPKLIPQGRRFFAVDSRGTVRRTICIGPWALKVARNATGRRCNRFEADLWARTTLARRDMLCPVLARLPFGLAICMPRAQPLSEDEAKHLRNTRGFPDWDYVPPDEGEPFEYKASDWGRCRMVDSSRWTIRRRLW
jgi:hypothetical protein